MTKSKDGLLHVASTLTGRCITRKGLTELNEFLTKTSFSADEQTGYKMPKLRELLHECRLTLASRYPFLDRPEIDTAVLQYIEKRETFPKGFSEKFAVEELSELIFNNIVFKTENHRNIFILQLKKFRLYEDFSI